MTDVSLDAAVRLNLHLGSGKGIKVGVSQLMSNSFCSVHGNCLRGRALLLLFALFGISVHWLKPLASPW